MAGISSGVNAVEAWPNVIPLNVGICGALIEKYARVRNGIGNGVHGSCACTADRTVGPGNQDAVDSVAEFLPAVLVGSDVISLDDSAVAAQQDARLIVRGNDIAAIRSGSS